MWVLKSFSPHANSYIFSHFAQIPTCLGYFVEISVIYFTQVCLIQSIYAFTFSTTGSEVHLLEGRSRTPRHETHYNYICFWKRKNSLKNWDYSDGFKTFFFFFLGSHPGHMEVPRLGIECQPQPQQRGIQATSVTYTTAQGNNGFLTYWARPEIEPVSSWILARFVSHEPQRELPKLLNRLKWEWRA